jgi:hypothetical protein
MAELYMSPRSYTYSGGDLIPYRSRSDFESAPGVALGTEPGAGAPVAETSAGYGAPRQGGGFLEGLDRVAGALLPFANAALAFKRGYDTGLPLPGSYGGNNRMAGQELMFTVLQDMRERNERAAEQARSDREAARERDLRNQILLKAYEKKEVTLDQLLRGIESGDLGSLATPEPLPSQAPAAPAAPKAQPK